MKTRRRDAVLQSLEAVRQANSRLGFTHLLAFLYIAENEGLSITELAMSMRTTVATASRNARALYHRQWPEALAPFAGLVEPRPSRSLTNGRALHLSAAGADLRDVIDGHIAAGVPLRLIGAAA